MKINAAENIHPVGVIPPTCACILHKQYDIASNQIFLIQNAAAARSNAGIITYSVGKNERCANIDFCFWI